MTKLSQDNACRYCPPASNAAFIEEYESLIRRIIANFAWGGVRHLALNSADDIYQELIMAWLGGDYLHVYDPNAEFVNTRTGDSVRCTFDNFVSAFTVRRLYSWRDKLNRQAFRISSEFVPNDSESGYAECEVDGVRYIYRRRFKACCSLDDNVNGDDGQFTLSETVACKSALPPDKELSAREAFKALCVEVYTVLKQIPVVSKRNYAELFRVIVTMSTEQGEPVQQTQLAQVFKVSTSTISLMLKHMRDIPVVREFEGKMLGNCIER